MARQTWLAAILWRSPRLRARLLRLRVALARLNRQASAALVGAALVATLGVSAAPPRADAIMVAGGEVAVSDNGLCSLIEAIHNANDTATGLVHADCAAGTAGGADEISLPAGAVFTLTAADNTTYGPSGLPVITSDMTISGDGGPVIRRDPAAEPFRVLAVGREGNLTFRSTEISGGQAAAGPGRAADVSYAAVGGGLLNLGNLNLSDAVISGNVAQVGGGVYNAGYLSAGNLTLNDNHSPYGGSALLSFGEAHIQDIVARQNGGGEFGSVVDNEGVMSLTGGSISDNETAAGLLNRGDATVTGITLENGDYIAVANSGGELMLADGAISGHAIGVTNDAAADVARMAIVDNGRGILNSQGIMNLVNSTISGNRNSDDGGGILVIGGSVHGQFNTITDNAADRGGGVYVAGGYTYFYQCIAGFMRLSNSIISGNQATTGPEAYVRQDSFRCLGHLYLDGSFVGHDGEHGTVKAILRYAVVPDEPLAAIISPQWSFGAGQNPHHALPWGSPAVDSLPNETCELPAPFYAVDQLGHDRNADGDSRPSDRECDAGAVERQPLPYHAFAPFATSTQEEP